MIVEAIHLVNIKSYIDETISFREGINCILGLNGSGKSTLIEAIGVGLFNYNRYKNINQMIRYKEKRGLIEVDFIAEDNRRYQVSRTLRTQGGSVKLIDLENNSVVCEGNENVYPAIKKNLKISKTKEFSKMFEEIIAVPQGEFVSAFLLTPANRKENFDKLFELHVYKETANKLKELNDFLKDQYIIVLEKEIIDLEAQLKPYNERKQQEKSILSELNKMQKTLAKDQITMAELKNKKTMLEVLKKELDEARNNVLVISEKEQMIEKELLQKHQNLKASEEATSLVKANKEKYLKHQVNEKKISHLEHAFDESLALEKAAKNLEKVMEVSLANINNFTEQIYSFEVEEKQKKEAYESSKKQALMEQSELEENEKNLEELRVIFRSHRSEVEAKKQALQDAQQRYTYAATKAELIPNYEADFESKIALEIQELNDKSKANDDLLEALKGLEKKRNYLEKDIETARENATRSEGGMCPFLHEKCKNINEVSLVQYFDGIAQKIKQKIDTISEEIQAKKEASFNPKELAILVAEATKKQLTYQQDLKQKEELLLELKQSFFEQDEGASSLEDLLKSIHESLERETESIQELDQETLELERKFTEHTTLVNTQKLRNSRTNILIEETEKELKKLSHQLRDLEAKQLHEKRKNDEASVSYHSMKETLDRGATIKEELDALKQENRNLDEAKNTYIANEKKAKEYSQIAAFIKKAESEQQSLKDQKQGIHLALENLELEYSEKQYEQTLKDYQTVVEVVSGTKATIAEKELQLKELRAMIAYMDGLILQKQEKEEHLANRNNLGDFLQKMRKVYTELPSRLSTAYREYISVAATKLYREISKENVGIEMAEDYQVRILDGMNADTYKTMEQLSGGEQMSVAIAIRLSMLRHLSGVDIYFLDEPTINLDALRRVQVASVIQEAANELSQLFVISHDDTFDDITENIVKIVKTDQVSRKV